MRVGRERNGSMCGLPERETGAKTLDSVAKKSPSFMGGGGSLVMDATLLIPSIKAGKMTRTTDGWIGTYL